jgi:hypothetical protein
MKFRETNGKLEIPDKLTSLKLKEVMPNENIIRVFKMAKK